MTINPDLYFFLAVGCWLSAGLSLAGLFYASIKYSWVRKWIMPTFLVIILTYDLAQCSELTAKGYRPKITDSKGEKP